MHPEETVVLAVDVADRRVYALVFREACVCRELLVELVADEGETVVVAACAENELVVADDLRCAAVRGGAVKEVQVEGSALRTVGFAGIELHGFLRVAAGVRAVHADTAVLCGDRSSVGVQHFHVDRALALASALLVVLLGEDAVRLLVELGGIAVDREHHRLIAVVDMGAENVAVHELLGFGSVIVKCRCADGPDLRDVAGVGGQKDARRMVVAVGLLGRMRAVEGVVDGSLEAGVDPQSDILVAEEACVGKYEIGHVVRELDLLTAVILRRRRRNRIIAAGTGRNGCCRHDALGRCCDCRVVGAVPAAAGKEHGNGSHQKKHCRNPCRTGETSAVCGTSVRTCIFPTISLSAAGCPALHGLVHNFPPHNSARDTENAADADIIVTLLSLFNVGYSFYSPVNSTRTALLTPFMFLRSSRNGVSVPLKRI